MPTQREIDEQARRNAEMIRRQKARTAPLVAQDTAFNQAQDAMGEITPIVGKTTPQYAKNEIRRAQAGQLPLGDANLARAQAKAARSPDAGALIPSEKIGQANMLAAMPKQGSMVPYQQPTDIWLDRSRQFTAPRVSQTHRQLETMRGGLGSDAAKTNVSMTEMISRVNPAIRESAQERMKWHMMTPVQRKEEIENRISQRQAHQLKNAAETSGNSAEFFSKSARLGDATGLGMDSFGYDERFYSPETLAYRRQGQRELEQQWAKFISGADRTSWDSPKEAYQAMMSLPAAQKYDDMLASTMFSLLRQTASPEMRLQMQAENINQRNATDAFLRLAPDEIRNIREKTGGKYTAEGNKELITELYLNKENDMDAAAVIDEIYKRTGIPRVVAVDGRIVEDAAHRQWLENERSSEAQKQKDIKSEQGLLQQKASAERELQAKKDADPNFVGYIDESPTGYKVVDIKAQPKEPSYTDTGKDYKTQKEYRTEKRELNSTLRKWGDALDDPEKMKAKLAEEEQRLRVDDEYMIPPPAAPTADDLKNMKGDQWALKKQLYEQQLSEYRQAQEARIAPKLEALRNEYYDFSDAGGTASIKDRLKWLDEAIARGPGVNPASSEPGQPPSPEQSPSPAVPEVQSGQPEIPTIYARADGRAMTKSGRVLTPEELDAYNWARENINSTAVDDKGIPLKQKAQQILADFK